MNEHEHPITHLSELDRRKFLKTSLAFSGLVALGSLAESPAFGASTAVTLAGFSAFSKSVKISKNSKYYLVESNGIPDHPMMIGIKSWQQQIPTVQPYTGSNAWSIPIKPAISKNPISGTGHFLRGAIAIAVNGVPIFNALNNRGDDAYLSGELDDWGGHCGRADDYHYHIAPTCIMSNLSPSQPVAWALDGFPIMGLKEVDGTTLNRATLDTLNGHTFNNHYHYHASLTRPYINKGFKGTLQTNILPTVKSIRPTGAVIKTLITDFYTNASGWTVLKYTKNGGTAQLNYKLKSGSSNCYDFVEINENGVTTSTSAACR
jgi:hypothetical protein